jgi:hypothetical protein
VSDSASSVTLTLTLRNELGATVNDGDGGGPMPPPPPTRTRAEDTMPTKMPTMPTGGDDDTTRTGVAHVFKMCILIGKMSYNN